MISEILLHVYTSYVSQESLQPGLIQGDAELGWKLAANWQGEHEHFDYAVRYSTDFKREREMVRAELGGSPGLQEAATVIIVGDSFTFGLGVSNEDTFSQQLQFDRPDLRVINGGVPGYSPEQAALLATRLARRHQPELIAFVLYLGNDLIDIGHEFSVQVSGGKPYIELGSDGSSKMVNVPVQRPVKPDSIKGVTLGDRILKESPAASRIRTLQLVRTELIPSAEIDYARLDHSVRLFSETIALLESATSAEIVVIQLPGSSAMDRRGGVSAEYQLAARERVSKMLKAKGIDEIDLYTALKTETAGALFYPNDGHLTPLGHKVVATKLASVLPDLRP